MDARFSANKWLIGQVTCRWCIALSALAVVGGAPCGDLTAMAAAKVVAGTVWSNAATRAQRMLEASALRRKGSMRPSMSIARAEGWGL